MSVLDLAAQRAANTSTRRRSGEPKPDAKIWLNIGYKAGDVHVTLPYGLAIDTMDPVRVGGSNEDFNKLQAAKNAFLAQLQKAAEKLQPGEAMEINLVGSIQRVNEPADVDTPDKNELILDIGELFAK